MCRFGPSAATDSHTDWASVKKLSTILDHADELHRWSGQGRLLAVATVATVGGSTPRQPGAALAVEAEGTAIGSVSGGCVEGAVYELCQEALETRAPSSSASGYSVDDGLRRGTQTAYSRRSSTTTGTAGTDVEGCRWPRAIWIGR
jgi:hypothetical protein